MQSTPISFSTASSSGQSSAPTSGSTRPLSNSSRSDKRPKYTMTTKTTAQETHALVHSQIFQEFHCDFCMEAVATDEAMATQELSREAFPSLPDTEGSFGIFHNLVTRKIRLERLLEKSRDKTLSFTIPQADVKSLLESCQQQHAGAFASTQKCQTLAFRILHNMAEHGWELPSDALDVFIRECRDGTDKNLPYAAMALGQRICQDPSKLSLVSASASTLQDQGVSQDSSQITSEEMGQLLDRTVRRLWNKDPSYFLEAIMIILAAKAKLAIPLSPLDLEKIKCALIEVNSSTVHPLHSPSDHVPPNPSKPLVPILKSIKSQVRARMAISDKELGYVIECYDESRDPSTRNRILQILHALALNQQRVFPKQEEFFGLLKGALTTFDFKLRSHALVVANELAVNNELNDPMLRKTLVYGKKRQHRFALTALSCHIRVFGKEQIAADQTWNGILEQLKNNPDFSKSLKELIDYLLFQLHGELKHLESLLDNREKCIQASAHCLTMAKQPQVIPEKIIDKLVSLIVGDSVPEATINALNTFGYLAKHSQEVPVVVISKVMKMCIPTSSADPMQLQRTEAALFMLRHCVGKYGEVILCDRFFKRILNCLGSRELISPLCLTLSKAIDATPKDALHHRLLPIIKELIFLLDGTLDEKIKISIVLGKAAEKGFIFDQSQMDRLITLACQVPDRTLESRLLQVIGTVINRSKEMEWSSQLFTLLIGICQTGQDVSLQNAGFLLCHYLRILKGHVPSEQVFELVTALSREKTVMIAFLALKTLVEKRKINPIEKSNPIDERSVKKLASIMLDERCEIHGDIAQLVAEIAGYQQIVGQIILEVIAGLNAIEENVMTASIAILRENSFTLTNIGSKNIKKVIENLRMILEQPHVSFRIRSDILQILTDLSCGGEITFSYGLLEQLILLFNDPHVDVRVGALILVKMQAMHWRASTIGRNPLMGKLETAIVPCLREEDLSSHALSLLEKMVELSHFLSNATLDQIVRIFFDQTRSDILDTVHEILSGHRKRLSNEAKQFFKMLEADQVLRHNQQREGERVQKVKELTRFVKGGTQVIEGVFYAIILILKEFRSQLEDNLSQSDSQELLKYIMKLCETVLYFQRSSPHQLLQALCKIEEWRLTSSNQSKRSLLIAKYLVANQSVDPIAFSVLEEGFLKDHMFEEMYHYLPALDVAVKRNFRVKPETVARLWEMLFLFKNEEELSYCVEILLNIFADSIYARPGEYYIDELVLIVSTSSVDLQEKLNRLLVRLTQLIVLKENQLETIYQQIQTEPNFQRQYELCCLLDTQSRKRELPQKYVRTIAAKLTENQFLIEADQFFKLLTDVQARTHVLSQLRGRLNDLAFFKEKLSDDFFARLAELIRKLPSNELRPIIECLRVIAEWQNLSDEVLQSLLLRDEHLLDSSIEILQHHIHHQRALNSGVLACMETILLQGRNGGLRRKIYELLMTVKNYPGVFEGPQTLLSEGLQSLLNAELDPSNLQRIKDIRPVLTSLYNHVREGGRLSIGNAEILISFLKNPYLRSESEVIFKVFDQRKSDLPPSIYESLFDIYKTLFLYEKDHQPLFYAFFKFVFSNAVVASRNGPLLYEYLLNGISKRNEEMTHYELKLLRFLAKQHGIVNSDLSIKVFKFFSRIHPAQHKQFLYLVFEQLIRLPSWTPQLLKHFHTFIEQMLPNHIGASSVLIGASQSSSSLLSDLTDLFMKPFSPSSRQDEIQPINDELRPILLTFCDYVVEDERSRGVFRHCDDWCERIDDWMREQLIKHLPQGEDCDLFKEQFLQYLTQLRQADLAPRVEHSHHIHEPTTTSKVRYRQFLRVLFFKQQEERFGWKEVNEFLGIVCCFPWHSQEFLLQSMEGDRDWFVKLLTAPFTFSRKMAYKQMKELCEAYQSLKWLPEQGY